MTNKYIKTTGYLLLLAVFIWAARAVEFDPKVLWANREQLWFFIKGMYPPDFEIFYQVFDEVLITIQLAFVATVLATLGALPLGFLAARNVMPKTTFGISILQIVRF